MKNTKKESATTASTNPVSIDTLPPATQKQSLPANTCNTQTNNTVTKLQNPWIKKGRKNSNIVESEVTTEAISIVNLDRGMSEEAVVEIMKNENNKSAIALEHEKQNTFSLEIRDREAKNAETIETRKLYEAESNARIEEGNLLKLQQKTLEQERKKNLEEESKNIRAKGDEKKRVKDAAEIALKLKAKKEITDLREFAQRELMAQVLNCNGNNTGTYEMSELIDNKRVFSTYPITLSDGSDGNITDLILNHHKTVQIADLVEPKKGNDVATLRIQDTFSVTIETPQRGGEVYTVHFSPEAIISMIDPSFIGKGAFTQNLIDYLSNPTYSPGKSLQDIVYPLKAGGFITEDTDFTALVNDRAEENTHNALLSQTAKIMKDYHCEIVKGKPTFLDRKGNSYTAASLIQIFSGKNNMVAHRHPITKTITKHNPAKLWIEEKMYDIFDGTVFYPSSAYDGREFNSFQGFKHQAEKLMSIRPFIEYVNEIGCSGDKKVSSSLWSFYANKVQGNIKKYSALAIVSDEDDLASLLLKGFRKVFEEYYFRVNDKKQLSGVNTVFEDKLIVEIDDEFLKDKSSLICFEELVKESDFSYQVKNGVYETKPNYTSCITISQDHRFVSKMAKKKMLIVAEVSNDRADDIDYLDSIRDIIDDPRFAPSLMHYLKNFKFMEYESLLKRPPANTLSNEEVEEGFTTVEKWFYKQLQACEFKDVTTEAGIENRIRVSSKSSLDAFHAYAKSIGDKSVYTDSVFGTKISRFMKGENLKKGGQKMLRHDVTGEINAIEYAPLSRCREAFEKYTGLQNPDWVGDTWKIS